MIAHADRACPAPLVQILSVSSTDTAKKAALITQRTALINEGKANPIASTRKEYLDMKARHCPAPHPAARTRHRALALSLSRTEPQLSAPASSSPTPPPPPLTCAGGLLRLRACQVEGSKVLVAEGRHLLPRSLSLSVSLSPCALCGTGRPPPPSQGGLRSPRQ